MAFSRLSSPELRAHKGTSFTGIGVVFLCYDGKGKFLMSKRSKNCRDEQGKWEVPGGGLDWGISAVDNVRRELKEELDVEPKKIDFMGYRDVFRTLEDGTPTHWLMLDFAVLVDSDKVKRNEPDKADAIGWFTPDTQPSPVHSQHHTLMSKYRDYIEKIC